jgi:hypothetical protein
VSYGPTDGVNKVAEDTITGNESRSSLDTWPEASSLLDTQSHSTGI